MNPARLVLPAVRARDGSFEHESDAVDLALKLGVGGFIIFGGTRESVGQLTAEIQERAAYPLLLAADLERGAGQQFRGLTVVPPPRALAHLGSADIIHEAAAMTAREARSVGINWIFAPVADLDVEPRNPIVQTRSFGADPRRVGAAVVDWITGCQSAGALACAKHFPGHGRTIQDSHATLPVVAADRATLENDLAPFRMAVAAGVASIMTAHVAYPALDPGGLPATRSPRILSLLRNDLGFDGLVVTDALMMSGATAGASEADAVHEVISAGVDLLLYPKDVAGVVAALHRHLTTSAEFAQRISASLVRREALLASLRKDVEAPDLLKNQLAAERIANALVDHGFLRGSPGALTSADAIDLVIIDDDVDGDWPASPNSFVAEALTRLGVAQRDGGRKVVLAFCEARAGKGRGDFGERSLALLQQHQDAALMVLFGHSRLVDVIPGDAPVVCAWHRQALMQEAVARQLARWMA